MREMRLAILFSGNGSNLENVYKKMQGMVIDSAESQNLIKNNSVRSTQNSPASWCKKSESKGAEVPPADFLLEAEKRGSPPKSEKAAAFWRVGGAGRGVQPFLRKETSKNDGKGFAESIKESQSGLPRRFCESARNDEYLNSSPTAQNDKIIESAESSETTPQDEFAAIKLNFVLAISSKESAFGITRCNNLGLKCEVVDYKKNKADFFQKIMQILRDEQIDLVVLAGFMRILPPTFTAKFRAINIHPSILPLFKGANAIRESFESDMKIAGVSVHFVSDELDSGALIAQDIIHKIEGESLELFEARIHNLEYEIYPKAIIKAIQMLKNASFGAESVLDSANLQNLQGGLPRSLALARNDEILDSSLRKCSAQNDNLRESAESSLDSTLSKHKMPNL